MRRVPLFRAADTDSLTLLPERKLYWAILARTAKDADVRWKSAAQRPRPFLHHPPTA